MLFTELSGTLSEDLEKAAEMARELQATGRQFGDANLVGLGVLSEGLALMKKGSVDKGMRLLDEAMLAAVSDELAPEWAGYIYCQLMAACHELGDLERAREWTRATERWCDSLQSPGPFLGVCRVHRAQIFQTQGAWQQAEIEAARACEQLAGFDTGNVAEGHYRIGELRRLRGDFAAAERSFREAHALGRDPQPGLALLRLAQGRVDEARTSIQTSLATGPSEVLHRAWLCVACVEVSLAADAVEAARTACDELGAAASAFGSSALRAAAGQAHGAVLLAEGDAPEALRSLRSACLRWQQLDAPYDVARARALLASAYEALGDRSAAGLEMDAAEQVFRSLGALPDLLALQRRRSPSALPNGLTERELAVLTLVSAGQTNRGIAEALTISEKTVARHLSNIYAKLGLSSRTEAARFAFDHGLVTAHG
jgi:DNA-binding NarL/FixJ family response regulator